MGRVFISFGRNYLVVMVAEDLLLLWEVLQLPGQLGGLNNLNCIKIFEIWILNLVSA